jgi:hypothetical protein
VSKPSRTRGPKAPDDDALAFELAAAARPHLSRVDADRFYIAIGVGDTFEAIDALITAIARDRIPLGRDVVATVATWLDCYRGQDAEPRLRQLLADVKDSPPQHLSAFERRCGPAPGQRRTATAGRARHLVGLDVGWQPRSVRPGRVERDARGRAPRLMRPRPSRFDLPSRGGRMSSRANSD